MASSATPTLIIPDEKSILDINSSQTSTKTSVTSTTGSHTKKLTKILSTQSSFERHHSPHPVGKRFSIDADPKSVILNIPVSDLSNQSDVDEKPSINLQTKHSSPARSPSLKKSDSFLEIPYEKGEIVDLIKLADDPNAATHVTDDGQEVLVEHGVTPHDAIKSQEDKSREARNAFISNRLLPGVYFTFLTVCGLLGGFGIAFGRTKKRETTPKLTQQVNATKLFDDGQQLAVRALRRATIYSVTGVFSFSCLLWLISGRPKTFAEFRLWTGSWLPSIKSKKSLEEEEGRTEFENLTDLMQYLIDEDNKLKDKKKRIN